jgi:hypothetical protein
VTRPSAVRAAIFAVAVLVTATAAQPAATAAPAPPAGPAEVAAEGQRIAPLLGAGTQSTASERVTATAERSVPQTGVDAATHEREKREAITSPTSGTPESVPLPSRFQTQQSVNTIFDGLDRPGSANNGQAFNPPDTIVGKSPTRILEATNSAARLSTSTGGALQTLDLNTFYGAAVANGRLFDPKVYYDRNATNPRFFLTALQQAGRGDTNAANNISRIWLAIARSPNPANLAAANWCFYNIEGRRNIGTADESWADFPGLGAGADSFSITTNQFRFPDDSFTFAVIRAFNKTVAENNAASCPTIPSFSWQPAATAGDFSQFTIQPGQHYTSPSSFTSTTNPAYFLSTTRGTSTDYHVWRIRNVASGAPTLAHLVLAGPSYGIPPSSPQPGSAILVATGDNRMLQTAGIGNNVIGTMATVCNFTAATPNESCSRTPRVTVSATAAGGLTATIAENTFAGFTDNIFVHHNSIATNSALQSGATWEFSGSGNFLSSAAMIKNVNAAWTGVVTYATGTCALPATAPSTTTARSGDYSGAQTDPALTTMWLAGEQAVTISAACQWRTRIGQLVP